MKQECCQHTKKLMITVKIYRNFSFQKIVEKKKNSELRLRVLGAGIPITSRTLRISLVPFFSMEHSNTFDLHLMIF